MKAIIERNLPLNLTYTLIDKKYIPLVEGFGCVCANCNKLIANIATVKNSKGDVFNIGFDCLESILINNMLLSDNDIELYKYYKSMIPKIIRFSKLIKETTDKYNSITGILFETQTYKSDYYTYYWLQNNQLTSRQNDYVKFKDIDFDFMVETIKNIFPKLTIIKN
jgi:hypothetical protein